MSVNVRGRLLALFLSAGATACGEVGPTAEITAKRTASRPSSPVLPGATPRERFEVPTMRAPEQGSDDLIGMDYDLPEGWKVLARTSDRLVNLLPAGDPEAACYLSFLGGSAGGLEANVNRWRTQFGAAPLSVDEVAALPRVTLLGRQGTLVEAAGSFTGMGEAPRAGFQMLGLVVSEPGGSLFLKFTGPSAVVEREREHFLAFASSLAVAAAHGAESPSGDGHEHAEGDGHDHGEAAAPAATPAAPVEQVNGLAWKTPVGWTVQPPRMMREVSFTLSDGAECYVTRLLADAGGLRANLDRWSDQVGRGRLSDEAFAALEEIPVLGQRVPFLDLAGVFKGMDGVERAGQGLLGVAVIRARDSLFVKLTGPEAVVRAERENFRAFVSSLEEGP
ncbi:MAG: hypothetical protein HOP15_09525 [Planctomycetes bacterium]|nr:hypothetical protein [Planctomycetota bacterium]